MNQMAFLIKFSDAFANKSMGRVFIIKIFPFVMNWQLFHKAIPAPISLKHMQKNNVNYLSDGICNQFRVRNIKYFFGLFCKSCLVFFAVLFVWTMQYMNSLFLKFNVVEEATTFFSWLLYWLRLVNRERTLFRVTNL